MFISRWASLSSWMGRPKQIVIHFNKEPRVNSEPTTHDCKRKKSIHSFRANRHTIIYNCSGRKFGCCLPINLWLCDSSFGYFGTFSSLRSRWSRWRVGERSGGVCAGTKKGEPIEIGNRKCLYHQHTAYPMEIFRNRFKALGIDNRQMLKLIVGQMEINVKKSTKRKECKLNFQTCVWANALSHRMLNTVSTACRDRFSAFSTIQCSIFNVKYTQNTWARNVAWSEI